MSKFATKFSAVSLAVITMVSLAGPVSAQSVADLQAMINSLLAQINSLQSQLTSAGGSAAGASSYTFTRDLTVGSKGTDVSALQQVLINGKYLKAVSAPTGFFGPATQAALAAWQKDHSISPAVGYFGPKTRSAMGSVAGTTGGSGVPVVVPSGTDLQVSLASDSPLARTIGSGTAFNPALKIDLSAGSKAVSVSSIKVMKSGFIANSNLNGVDIVDSMGNRYGNVVSSINADNTILFTFGSSPIVVPAGQKVSLIIRFNLTTGSYTGTVSFGIASVSAITADTTAISGAFPINGSAMNIVNGGSSLASTTLDVLVVGSSSLNVDAASEQDITKFRIQEMSSNEGVYLYKLSLYNYGNAGASDYKDVQLVAQDGTVLTTAQPSGQMVNFDLSAAPYFIDKGLTKDFTVRAKLIGGTTKTINLVVYNNYDVDVRGASTQVSVIPNPGTNDTSFPIGNGWNIQTIGSGTMQFNRDASSPSSAAVPGATNVVLAKYYAKPTGENMELRQVSFGILQTGTALSGTVAVKVNDQIVYSAAASTFAVNGSVNTISLSSYPSLAAGANSYITVEASISSNATSSNSYTVKSFDLLQVKRLITNDLIDPSVGASDGNQIAVQAAAMTITNLSIPVQQSVVAGTNQFELADVQFNVQSGGEDVRLTSVIFTDTLGGGSDYSGVSNLTLWQGSTQIPTTGSTATNGSTVTFTFQNAIVISRSTPITFVLKGDIVNATGVSHTYKVANSSGVNATGKDTGNSLTSGNISVSGSGQVMTVSSAGSLSLSVVSGAGASPSTDQLVSAGTTGGTYFAFKMTSQTETQKITSLKITATSTGSTGLTSNTLRNLALYEGNASTPFASTPQMSCSAGQCTYTWTSPDNLLSAPVPMAGVTVYVKADIGSAGQVDLGNSFKFLIASTSDVAVKGSVSATTTATVTGTPTASGITYVVPFRVTIDGVSPTAAATVGLNGGQTIGVFKVTNGGSSPIYLGSTTFANSGSATATVTFDLYSSVSGGGSADASVTYATNTATVGFGDLSAVSEANRTIPGGSYRYLTVKTRNTAVNNDSFQLSVSALGNIKFYAKESDLGYSGNPSNDNDVSDTINGLYVEGIPSLSTVTAKT